jgi:hypothetical protein
MKISIRQQGGLFDLDREVSVDKGTVKITEDGAQREIGLLPEAERARVESLAARVAAASDRVASRGSDLPADPMETEIAIEDGAQRRQLKVISGDAAPDELWELIGLVNELGTSD